MTELSPEIKLALHDEYGPILAQFTIEKTPAGAAPEHIRAQWVDLALPVREVGLARLALGATEYLDYLSLSMKQNKAPVSIAGIEAVHALLEAGRDKAAEFWMPYQLGLFTFRVNEGRLEDLEQGQ